MSSAVFSWCDVAMFACFVCSARSVIVAGAYRNVHERGGLAKREAVDVNNDFPFKGHNPKLIDWRPKAPFNACMCV